MSSTGPRRDSYESNKSTESSVSDIISLLRSPSQDTSKQNEPRNIDQKPKYKAVFWISIGNLLFLLISLYLLLRSQRSHPPLYRTSKNKLLKEMSFYSPILDKLEIEMAPYKMHASLWGEDPPSVYRGHPGPETDAAWHNLYAGRGIPISGDDVEKLGKDPKTAVKFPESFGYGPDAYVGAIDVFHQIHCLDELRKAMHTNYYRGFPSTERTTIQTTHLHHCIHVLMQNVMCESSVDLVTYNWREDLKYPFPDFDLAHKCRNFEAIRKWNHDHNASNAAYNTLSKPDDVVALPPPHQLIYDIFDSERGRLHFD